MTQMTYNMATQNYWHSASVMRLAEIIPTSARCGRLFLTLLMMLLTTASALAEEVMAVYVLYCNTTTKKTTLYNNSSKESVTWDFTLGQNENPWNAGATHGVDDEYDITFKASNRLTNDGSEIWTYVDTKFTINVTAPGYYIKSATIGDATATAGLHATTIDVTVPSNTRIPYFIVNLIRYHTVTPASGLQVTSGTSDTKNGTTYYKPGTTVTIAPTNQHHIVDGTGGTGSASASVANDKRSFSFTMPDQNVSPTATLTEVYQVSPASGITLSPAAYFTYGGAKYYKPGTTITLSSTVPTGQHVIYKAGNKTLDGNTYTVNSTDGDVTLTAEYPYNTYTVQFNGNGSTSGSMSNQSFTYGTAQNLTANAFRRTGYTFAGWNTKADGSGTSYDDQKSVNNLTTTNGGTVTLYAQWTANQYTITFDTNGGSAINPITQDYNTAITAPADPTRKGYTFAGWNPALPATMPAGNMTVTAQWEIVTYTITYNLDGGELPSGQSNPGTYTVETPTFTLNNPIKTGYTFDGWYDNEGLTGTPVTTIDKGSTGVKVLYAKWTANQYTITFDTNGGSAINPITQDYNTAITAPADPTRKGYTFAGWNPALPATMPAGNMTVTAQWEIVTYTITYNLDGGSVDPANPTSFTVETPTFTLTNPIKPGYTFTGWTEGDDNTLLPTVTIEQGSTTDRTYTANYEFAQITGGDLSFVCTSGTEAKVIACNPSVTSVTIPATVSNNDGTYTVTAIDATAFSGCTGLLVAILESATPPTLGSGAFSGCTALNAIGVPAGTATAYKSDASWLPYEDKIHAIDGTCGTNVYYSYDSTTNTLRIFGTGAMTDYSGLNMPWFSYREDITTVVIGHGVTSIGECAFINCSSLTSITIPASVTSIGDWAFTLCSGLTSIEIPASVASIGNVAFAGCTSLTSIEIPASVTSIGINAFGNCTSLESIVIPEGVTSIGDNAFDGCTSLTSIEIPASVTEIGGSAFGFCTSLENLEIPASVTSISGSAFTGCSALKSISVASENPNYDSRNDCNALIETETNWLIQGCNNTVIPDDVKLINNCAFWGCTGLTSITIPASVTEIGGDAFNGCTSLNTLIICPATPPTLGSNAFAGCTALNTIYVPAGSIDTYKSADGWADYKDKMQGYDGTCGTNVYYSYDSTTKTLSIFGTGAMANYSNNQPWKDYCEDITTVVIDDGVTSIGNAAFLSCTSLTSIEIPASVTSIGEDAFYGCTSLASIDIPASVTSIGDGTFHGCTSLASIDIPDGVTSVGISAFHGCTSLASIEIPEGVTSIGEDAFNGCTSLSSISIPASVTSIGYDAFSYCTSLTSIVIPDGVTSIGFSTFMGCTSLASIEIPASVTDIGDLAFYYCSSLNTLIIYSATPPTVGSSTFYDCTALNIIGVPSGTAAAYKAADGWKDYADKIHAIDGTCGTNVYYSYDSTTKTLHIFGTGAMTDYYGEGAPWNSYCTDITTVVISTGVTSIGNSAFSGCTSLLTVFLYSETPPALGSSAFAGCTALNVIGVPAGTAAAYKAADGWLAYEDKIYAIDGTCGADGSDVYYSYDGTTKTLYIFGTGAMADYDNNADLPWYSYRGDITTVVITNGVTSIGNHAFRECTSLASIDIPASVTSIGNYAFWGCTGLLDVMMNSATPPTLGSDAFYGCSSLNAIYVPSGAIAAYKSADGWKDYKDKILGYGGCGDNVLFTYDSTTKTLSISGTGAMADYNGEDAPWNSYCTDITTVIIGDGVTSIGNSAFSGCTSLTRIEIPASVTSIGNSAFSGCTSLTRIEIPASVTSIGNNAFSGCTNLLIAFLESETPPTLGSGAFSGCTALNAIGVPAGTAVAYKAADGWLDYAEKIHAIDGTCGADGSDVYYSYDGTTKTLSIFGKGAMAAYYWPWSSYLTEITTIVISDGVTSIGAGAFWGCTSLASIEIPASVTSIDSWAFYGCTSLASIVIPDGVTSIGEEAFLGCTSLESLEIPASVTSIGENAFNGCSALESISVAAGNTVYDSRNDCNALIETATNTLIQGCNNTVIPDGSDGVTSIGDYAFLSCTSLTSIEIPDGVTSIGGFAFGGCTGLTSIEIPASVTSIGENAFTGCTALESISVAAGNTVYDSRHDCNAIIEIETNTLIQGCKNTVIPDGSDGVTSIGDNAFSGCTSLTSIEIPDGVTSIGIAAFDNCTSLTSIEIPASVTSIDDWAFDGCTSLASVIIYAPELDYYGSDAFYNNAEGRKIYVYNDCLETYKAQASRMGVDENDILAIESMVLRGDANGDGQVTIADAVAVANYILGNPSVNFNIAAADMNGDGNITITDGVSIVNMLQKQ